MEDEYLYYKEREIKREPLFWKVIRNKYIFKLIFHFIESDEINYNQIQKYTPGNRKKFKNITSFKELLDKGLISLLKCKLNSNYQHNISYGNEISSDINGSCGSSGDKEDYIEFEIESIKTFFSRSYKTNPFEINDKEKDFLELFKLIMDKRRMDFEILDLVACSIECKNFKVTELLLSTYQLQITPKYFESLLFSDYSILTVPIEAINFILNLPKHLSPLSKYSFYEEHIEPLSKSNYHQNQHQLKKIKTLNSNRPISRQDTFKELQRLVILENKFKDCNYINGKFHRYCSRYNYRVYLCRYHEAIDEIYSKDENMDNELLFCCFVNNTMKLLQYLIGKNHFKENQLSTDLIERIKSHPTSGNLYPTIVINFLIALKNVDNLSNVPIYNYLNVVDGILQHFNGNIYNTTKRNIRKIINLSEIMEHYQLLLKCLPPIDKVDLKLPLEWNQLLASFYKIIHKIKGHHIININDINSVDWIYKWSQLDLTTLLKDQPLNSFGNFFYKIHFNSLDISNYAYNKLVSDNGDQKLQQLYNPNLLKNQLNNIDVGLGTDTGINTESPLMLEKKPIIYNSFKKLIERFKFVIEYIGDVNLEEHYDLILSYFEAITNFCNNGEDSNKLKFDANKHKRFTMKLLQKSISNYERIGIKILLDNGFIIKRNEMKYLKFYNIFDNKCHSDNNTKEGNSNYISMVNKEIMYWINEMGNNYHCPKSSEPIKKVEKVKSYGNNTTILTTLITTTKLYSNKNLILYKFIIRSLYVALLSTSGITYNQILNTRQILDDLLLLDVNEIEQEDNDDEDDDGIQEQYELIGGEEDEELYENEDYKEVFSFISFRYLCFRSIKFNKFVNNLFNRLFYYVPFPRYHYYEMDKEDPGIGPFKFHKAINPNIFTFNYIFSSSFDEIMEKIVFEITQQLSEAGSDFPIRFVLSNIRFFIEIKRFDLLYNEIQIFNQKFSNVTFYLNEHNSYDNIIQDICGSFNIYQIEKLIQLIKEITTTSSVVPLPTLSTIPIGSIYQFIDLIFKSSYQIKNYELVSFIINNYKGYYQITKQDWYSIINLNHYQITKLIFDNHGSGSGGLIELENPKNTFSNLFTSGNIRIIKLLIKEFPNYPTEFINENLLNNTIKSINNNNIHIIKHFYKIGLIDDKLIQYLNQNNVLVKSDFINFNWYTHNT